MLFLRTEAKLLGIPLGHYIVPYYPGDADFNVDSFTDTASNLIRMTSFLVPESAMWKVYRKRQRTSSINGRMMRQSKKVLMDINWASGYLAGRKLLESSEDYLEIFWVSLLGEKELVGLKLDKDNVPSIGAGSDGLFRKQEGIYNFS